MSILLIANSVIKSTRSIHDLAPLSQRKACRQSSRSLAVWSRQSLPRSPVQLKATPLEAHVKTQDHCDTDMNSNLALAAWLAAKRTRQTFQFQHVPCQRRHLLLDAPGGPGARMDQNMYVSMTTRRVRATRRKNLRLQDRPRFELGNKQISLWVKKSILPRGGFLVYL